MHNGGGKSQYTGQWMQGHETGGQTDQQGKRQCDAVDAIAVDRHLILALLA